MSEVDLLIECKKGLDIPIDSTAHDPNLKQKLLAVEMFMRNAGVKKENIRSPLGIGVVVMGVTDLWELRSGEVKFSPAFSTLVSQLSMMGDGDGET